MNDYEYFRDLAMSCKDDDLRRSFVSANHPHNSPPEKKHGKISSEGS